MYSFIYYSLIVIKGNFPRTSFANFFKVKYILILLLQYIVIQSLAFLM